MEDTEDLCGRRVGEFVLRERIGAGGFGAVYRCEQPLLGREAVVKVLHARLRRNDVIVQRFLREAQLASRLDHPYAAHVYAFGIERDDDLVWIAMEMVQGTTLARWLRERGPLPVDLAVPFIERVAEVVQTAHDRGIIHRDLKPSNMMVIERAGRLLPKLLDFGIAKLLDEAITESSPRLLRLHALAHGTASHADAVNPVSSETLTGSTAPPHDSTWLPQLTPAEGLLGSPPYMSPEQWNNAVTVGPSTDIYALALVAYEVLTGRRPFRTSSASGDSVRNGEDSAPPLPSGLSPALERVFARALAPQPEDRWGSALEFATALHLAAGLDNTAADLPRLDDAIRDTWLAAAPQPLAESIAALEGARNAHQALDAAQELARTCLHYLVAVALASHAHARGDDEHPELIELVRTMRRTDLHDDERARLLRLLLVPRASRRGAHPLPELIDLVAPPSDGAPDSIHAVLAWAASDRATTDEAVRAHLARLIAALSQLLRDASFLLDYVLVVPRNGAAERWTGLRRLHRAVASVRTGELVDGHPMLIDRSARICVDLWPLMQVAAPTESADPELFLFDGPGRRGARLVAAPAGFEHHDPGVWDWIATNVLAELESAPRADLDDDRPYLGLTSFSTRDAGRFVGREREIDALLNRLRQRPLHIVVGPSGAGKSSFVHAGVIPGLPASWQVVTMRPGATPLSTLASRLSAAGITAADLGTLLETSPADVAALVAQAASPGSIVLVVDQLEEMFTLCTSAAERLQFAAVIAQLAGSIDAPVRVICTIRDDFLMQLEALAPVRTLLSAALVLLGNPSRDDLVRIIVEPARRAGYALSDPELADDMVTAVADRLGALALLSFTASRLWDLRDRRFHQLTRSAYDAMGGVGGALGQHAETTFEALSPSEQRSARDIVRSLVTAEGTRARVLASELRQRLATRQTDAVIDKLVAARLIVASDSDGDSHIEVIHEALIAAWPRLQQWMHEDVDSARMRDQLRAAARQWHERNRLRGLLWRDDALADFERWSRRSSPVSRSDIETAFVDASRRQARRTRWTRRALLALSASLALAAVLHFATLHTRTLKELADARLTQFAVEQGRHALLDGKHAEALIYLAEAERRGERSASLNFMLARAAQPFLSEQARLTTTSGRMWSAMFSRNGRWIVTTDDRSARLWDAKTYQLLHVLPHDGTVYDASFGPDDTRLVTASADGHVKLWDTARGVLVDSLTKKPLDGQPTAYSSALISPDGRAVAAISESGTVAHVWDAASGTFLAAFPNEQGAPAAEPALAFSRDGRWLATTGGSDARVFDTRTWKQVLVIPGPRISALSFDPTGARLATASRLGDTSIWAIPTGERIHHLHEADEEIEHVAYSPDGAAIVTSSRSGIERVWNTATGHMRSEIKIHHDGYGTRAEFDSSSGLVVSSGIDGVSISDVTTGIPVSVLEGARNYIASARFDPSSRRVIGASWDGTARVWDVQSSYRRWAARPRESDCRYDPDVQNAQRDIAISCVNQRTYVWDTTEFRLMAELPGITSFAEFRSASAAVSSAGDLVALAAGPHVAIYRIPGGQLDRTVVHPAAVSAVAFARSGHDLVSGSVDGTLMVTRDGEDSQPLAAIHGTVDAVAFTPDGQVLAASSERRLRLYDRARKDVFVEVDSQAPIRWFRMSADGRRLITVPTISTLTPPILWDLEGVRPISRLGDHQGQSLAARFVSDDRKILTAGPDGVTRLWDARTGDLEKTYFGNSVSLLDAALDPDGSTVVTAGGDGILRFWDASTARMIWTLQAHTSFVIAIHFEGEDLVTRSFNGEIARWSISRRPPPQLSLERIVRCLSLKFDEDTGLLVQLPPCSDTP